MFLEVKRIKPQRGELVTVQIVVDGDSFPFELNEIQFTASSRAEKWRFLRLWMRWWRAKQKSFVVEFQKSWFDSPVEQILPQLLTLYCQFCTCNMSLMPISLMNSFAVELTGANGA